MVLPSFMRKQTVQVKRYPRVQDHGNESIDYDADPAVSSLKGSVQPGTGQVDLTHRDGAEIAYTILAPLQYDVQHDDLIVYDGDTYFVNGEPERWKTGVLDHQVIRLSRWTG